MPFKGGEPTPESPRNRVLGEREMGLENCAVDLSVVDKGALRKPRVFKRCWFSGALTEQDVKDWEFEECTFDQSSWERIKFTRCKFVKCHFHNVKFEDCKFMETCVFKNNSASAETLILKDTLLNPTDFLQSIATNLEFLPAGVDAVYQKTRLIETKANLAFLLYVSTKDGANISFYNAAQKELILSESRSRIERHRFAQDSRQNPQTKLVFWRKTFIPRVEMFVVCVAGLFTDWGKSVVIPLFVMGLIVCVFMIVYFVQCFPIVEGEGVEIALKSLVKSVNITLVAGYTSYFDRGSSLLRQLIEVVNLILGILSYSLIIPVLARRVLR